MSFNNINGISNEQTLLIEILNSMYNDNLGQINNFTSHINNLNETNIQIRNLLVQLLNNNGRRNNNNDRRNARTNIFRNNINNNGLGRVQLNNNPYIIESLQEIRIPYNRINRNTARNANLSRIMQNFFQPIEVYPTQSQIEAATRIVRYSDVLSPRNRSCPISLDIFNDNDMVTIIRFCGHIFNTDEINTWFRSNCRCPVCRYDIRTYNSNALSEFFTTQESQNVSSSSSSNSQNIEQNNSVQQNEERNINNEERNTRPTSNENLLDVLLNNVNEELMSTVDNTYSDPSGNLLNILMTDTTSDPIALYNLIMNFGTRQRR